MFSPGFNIGVGTAYLGVLVQQYGSLTAAFKAYRGLSNGIYGTKIMNCAAALQALPPGGDPTSIFLQEHP